MIVQGIPLWIGRILLAGGLVFAIQMSPAITPAQAGAQRAVTLQGQWRNGDTTVRIAVNKSEVKGEFAQVGQLARELGFSVGEVALLGTRRDNFIFGEQTVRYGASQNCFRERGRKVPMMGRLRDDGQLLAIHFYNMRVDANCQDTGFYEITETLWERVPGQ